MAKHPMVAAQERATASALDYRDRLRQRYRKERSPENRRAYQAAERAYETERHRLAALRDVLRRPRR